MPEPRAFKLRQAENRPNNHTGALPDIDRKRATAVLVRQSKSGADTAQAESRETQLGLQEYGKLLYGEDEPNVRLYDEGAGVSGQKRIDQREKRDLLYQDMNKGIIGTIVLAREDRLFRNKHMDQVGAFTKLAEERKIKVIVPPISSASGDEKTRVYDFTVYRDLVAFQDKMREAYAYIEGHVKYMHWCQQNKADKGGYDGRALPPGLVVIGKKQDQRIIVYEPWAEKMRNLALRAQALNWDMGKINREVAKMAFLFPEIPEEDKERYRFRSTMRLTPGVGYKPVDPQTIRDWMTNEMLIGWFQPDEDLPDVIIDNHPAVLDYFLFAEGYAELKGYTLEGEPVENWRGRTRIRKTRETPPDLLFHGRLLVTPDRAAFVSVDDHRGKFYYYGYSRQPEGMVMDKFLSLPGAPFDNIVIDRLKALEKADKQMKDKVKATLEQVHGQQSEDFVSIHQQLDGIRIQLTENAKKRMKTSADDPMYALLQEEANDLLDKQKSLQAKKVKLGIVDSPEEIAELHGLLGNFEEVWPKFDLAKRQRAFALLINRIEVESVSPHWLRLSVDWLDAISPRLDIAYLWKAMPSRTGNGPHGKFSEEEKEILKQHYPRSTRLEILKLLPKRTWHSIQTQAELMQVKRQIPSDNEIRPTATYSDNVPKLDGKYLFRDYETTLAYIKQADRNSSRSEAPLYPVWLFSEKVEDLTALVEEHLNGVA